MHVHDEALALDAGNNLADGVFGDCIGLDDHQCAFHKKNIISSTSVSHS